MEAQREIEALIKLLDDPDEEVFQIVQAKLLSYGPQVIGTLESFWEQSLDATLQERIENLVHEIQFNSLKEDLNLWYQSGSFDLMHGALLLSRYQYPDLNEQEIINQIEEIKTEVWRNLQEEMSTIEKIKVLNHVLYTQYGYAGNTKNHHDPKNSFISEVVQTRKGNQISLAILYSTIAQKLDLPVYGVNLPQHFILAYIDERQTEPETQVLFYINAFNKGSIFGKYDIDQFLRQLHIDPQPGFYYPCTNADIIRRVIRNLISAFEKLGDLAKVKELQSLQKLLE